MMALAFVLWRLEAWWEGGPQSASPRLVPWLWRFGGEWCLLGALGAACLQWPTWAVWLLCWLLIGSRQHALGILGHEAVHGLVSPHWRVNRWAGRLALAPLGIAFEGYQRQHLAHHKYQGTAQDPDEWHKALVPSWLLGLLLDGVLVLWYTRPQRWRHWAAPIVWHGVLLGTAWGTGTWMLFLLWYGPLWTVVPGIQRLRWHTEHRPGLLSDWRPPHLAQWLCYPHRVWRHQQHHAAPHLPCWALTT